MRKFIFDPKPISNNGPIIKADSSVQRLKRCPECGTIVKGEYGTCSACGADLWNVQDEPLETAVVAEAKIEKVSEARLERKDIARAKRYQYLRLAIAIVGVILWIVAISPNPFGPGPATCRPGFGQCLPIINIYIAAAGLICIATAIDPWRYLR